MNAPFVVGSRVDSAVGCDVGADVVCNVGGNVSPTRVGLRVGDTVGDVGTAVRVALPLPPWSSKYCACHRARLSVEPRYAHRDRVGLLFLNIIMPLMGLNCVRIIIVWHQVLIIILLS